MNLQLVSTIRPLKTFCYVHKLRIMTLPRFVFTVTKVQTTPVLFVVIMRGLPTSARKAATFERDGHNIQADFAVAILQNSNTVGHVPRDISWYFLQKSGSEMTCIVDVNGRYSERRSEVVHV